MKPQEEDKQPKEEKQQKPGDQFAYPPDEDIYVKGQKEEERDTDDLSQRKSPNLKPDEMNEKSFKQDVSGADLDVPGAELDDAAEETGSEDEENNSYSLGGENHDD